MLFRSGLFRSGNLRDREPSYEQPAIALWLGKHACALMVGRLALTSWVTGCAGTVQSGGGNNNPPPAISLTAVVSSAIASDTATISWMTNVAGNSQVEYGTTASYGNSTALNSSMVTAHTVVLTGLSVSTTYHYRVKSADASNSDTGSLLLCEKARPKFPRLQSVHFVASSDETQC